MYDILGEKLLSRLRINFSHLKEHKFRHSFADTINPMCPCGVEVEATEHFFMLSRSELFDNLQKANSDFKNLSDKGQVAFMLYASKTHL